VFILPFFEKDTFSWYLPETASNLLRVAKTLVGAAAGASTEQNRAKLSISGFSYELRNPTLLRVLNQLLFWEGQHVVELVPRGSFVAISWNVSHWFSVNVEGNCDHSILW
jgi:hypothetical protein